VTFAPHLLAWLRRAATPAGTGLALRGSAALRALTPRGRPPVDLDHVFTGAITLADLTDRARAIAAIADPEPLAITAVEPLWADSPAPGIRVHIDTDAGALQVDLATNERLSAPPGATAIPGAGTLAVVCPEDLYAWKIHGLVEFGRGQWRPKDLYDADLIATELDLDPTLARAALDLAFTSRDNALAELDDFLTRPTWGTSKTGQRRWRRFAEAIPRIDSFDAIRTRVRTILRGLTGDRSNLHNL
jgi:hypothetical protein